MPGLPPVSDGRGMNTYLMSAPRRGETGWYRGPDDRARPYRQGRAFFVGSAGGEEAAASTLDTRS